MTWLSEFFGLFKSLQCWVTIAPWESALRVRFGKSAVQLGPGIHLRIPFTDRIFVQSVRLRPIFDTGQTITTKDEKVLTVSFVVYYAIDDMLKLYKSVSNPESLLIGKVQGAIASVVSNTISNELSTTIIELAVNKVMANMDWGLSQINLQITTFAYVRTYRLLSNEYRSLSDANQLEIPRV